MKKKLEIYYRNKSEGEHAPLLHATTLDELIWCGVYELIFAHDDASLGLPFRFDDNEKATLVVEDNNNEGIMQGTRKVVQRLSFIERSTCTLATYIRIRCNCDGKCDWGEWSILDGASTQMLQDGSVTVQKLSSDLQERINKSANGAYWTSGPNAVTLNINKNDGTVGWQTLYAATKEKAGVMSAEDKAKLEDTSKKTNNFRVVEASSETEEIVICNNDETEEIVKINNEGLTAKKIFNSSGEEIESSGMSVINEDPAILEICDEKQCPILTIDSMGNVNTASFNSLNVAKNKFKGKTMLYIGDSISTGNIWHWKGYIKDGIGLDYVDYNISDTINVTPAVGGITIRPHNDDDTRPMNAGAAEVDSGAKSIWWRCCNKRLGIYDFDYINLFGGTNDIYDNNLNVGSIDDAPLLDTDVEDLTDLDLSQVSFASAFMGCIEMLRRDFPSKQTFICTLLYNSYAKTPEVVKIQMLAAQKYGLKVVPFYYSELNSQNYQWLCDGFHPNQIAARIMEKNFVQYINL